jgi:hypothetical protein
LLSGLPLQKSRSGKAHSSENNARFHENPIFNVTSEATLAIAKSMLSRNLNLRKASVTSFGD